MSLITVSNLHIEFESELLFESVDLTVDAGEIVAIRTEVLDGGTTLLKALGGLLKGCGGSVIYKDRELLDDPDESIYADIGFVYEEKGLISLYSVYENISLPLQFHHGVGGQELADRVLSACARVGVDEALLRRRPHELNDVQTRLVNLARALVMEPGLLLIDELEGGMSEEMLVATMNSLHEHQQEHSVAIVMTTSSDIVESHADRLFDIHEKGLTSLERS